MTIYETTPGELYATGQLSISIFPSGLIRVDQTFVCKTSVVATHRSELDINDDFPLGSRSTPAIDGVYIYPLPQEIQRSDGFTDLVVSGYGRASNKSLIEPTKETYRFTKNQRANLGTAEDFIVVSFTRVFEAQRWTDTVVMPVGEDPPVIDIPLPILKEGPPPDPGYDGYFGYPPYNYTLEFETRKTNYGNFDECVTTYFYD
jgi:hypothetical protein